MLRGGPLPHVIPAFGDEAQDGVWLAKRRARMAALTIVIFAGPAAAKERVRPLLEAMDSQRIVDFGETIGAATATELVGNFMIIAAFVAGTRETSDSRATSSAASRCRRAEFR